MIKQVRFFNLQAKTMHNVTGTYCIIWQYTGIIMIKSYIALDTLTESNNILEAQMAMKDSLS